MYDNQHSPYGNRGSDRQCPLKCEFWGISNWSAPDMATLVLHWSPVSAITTHIPGQRPTLQFGLWTTSIRTLKTRSPIWAPVRHRHRHRHRHELPRAFLGRHVTRPRDLATVRSPLTATLLWCSTRVPSLVSRTSCGYQRDSRSGSAATSRCQVFLNHLLIHASACASRHFVAALSAMPVHSTNDSRSTWIASASKVTFP